MTSRISKTLTLLTAPLLVLALTAAKCEGSDPDPVQLYRQCVGSDRTHATQDRCQNHVWHRTFDEDDDAWDCTHMGNWQCGPAEQRM